MLTEKIHITKIPISEEAKDVFKRPAYFGTSINKEESELNVNNRKKGEIFNVNKCINIISK